MEQKNDIESRLVDSTGVNEPAIAAGLNWLAEHGGGCVVTPDKRTMENAFDVETDGQFKKAETKLGRYGITLSWKRRGMPFGSKSVMALYMDKEIDEVIQHGSVERVFFIPWMESESAWFKDAYRPTIVEVDEGGNLVPLADQPQRQSMEGLIPEEQDNILKILARMAAGYGNNLQWIERERFKADLMNYRSAWIKIDPKDVLRRCADLGMSAEDADEVSGMVKQLRDGHKFRPKHGYEDGWRH
ncbi:MAG: hypothetical protein IJH04_06505 [Eggerthellaceae bacterium]|nr:hypothetical protein [Eggerthellaceae bacterium]